MATQYPNDIDTLTTLPRVTNLVSSIDANDHNGLREAILAIQTELGANPSGTFGTLVDRLATIRDGYFASNVYITDLDGYYVLGNVEGALSQIGASIENLDTLSLTDVFWDASGSDITNINTGQVIIANGITSPGSGSNSELFGAGAIATGTNSVALGSSATTGNNSNAVAIGRLAEVTSSSSVAVGHNSEAAANAIALGRNTLAASTSISIGFGATSSANEFVAGSSSAEITDVYFGLGVTNASPNAVTFHGTGGLGTDISAGNLVLAGGIGTGTGIGGSLIFQTAPAGSTGSSANTLVSQLTIDEDGYIEATRGQVAVAWAIVDVVAGAASFVDYHGFSGVGTSGTDMILTFNTARPDGYYCVQATQDTGTVGMIYDAGARLAGSFTLTYYNTSFMATNWSSFTGTVHITVFDSA